MPVKLTQLILGAIVVLFFAWSLRLLGEALLPILVPLAVIVVLVFAAYKGLERWFR
jgi:hypothetical protein